MFNKKNTKPILVVVHDHRYDMYSLNPVPTYQDDATMAAVKIAGGISDCVKPGRYYCSIKRFGFLKTRIELTPAE